MKSEHEHSRVRYKAASVHPEARMLVARMAPLLKAEGLSYKRQREIYAEAGYDVSERTLRRHRAAEHEGQPALLTDKSSGRPEALTDRQTLVFIGWILHQTDEDEIAGIRECRSFIEDPFGFEVAQGTFHKYLMQNGFASHKGRRRTAGYKFDLEALLDLYEKDLERLWALGIKDMRPQDLACMDSSSLGWRLLTRKTYSPKGGTQPKIRKGNPSYNLQSDLVCEIGWTSCLQSIILIQVVSSRSMRRNTWGESQATIQHFLKHYPALQKCLILSDAGGSYVKKKVDIMKEWGADHATFTPAVHVPA
jgi:transposase